MVGTTRDQPLLTLITLDIIHDINVIAATSAQIDGGMIQVAQGRSVKMIMPGLVCNDQFNVPEQVQRPEQPRVVASRGNEPSYTKYSNGMRSIKRE
jgi:hypothetical protein